MKNFESNQSFRTFSESVSNKSYLELLERYILLDKTSDLDKKHKEWCNNLTNNWYLSLEIFSSKLLNKNMLVIINKSY